MSLPLHHLFFAISTPPRELVDSNFLNNFSACGMVSAFSLALFAQHARDLYCMPAKIYARYVFAICDVPRPCLRIDKFVICFSGGINRSRVITVSQRLVCSYQNIDRSIENQYFFFYIHQINPS